MELTAKKLKKNNELFIGGIIDEKLGYSYY